MLVAVPVLSAGYGCINAAIVATRGDLQLLLSVEIGEFLFCLGDVVLQYLSAKVDKRIGISLPTSTVASLSGYRMLDIDLDDPNPMELSVSWVAQFIDTVSFATRDRKEERRRKAVFVCEPIELFRKTCMLQAMQLVQQR